MAVREDTQSPSQDYILTRTEDTVAKRAERIADDVSKNINVDEQRKITVPSQLQLEAQSDREESREMIASNQHNSLQLQTNVVSSKRSPSKSIRTSPKRRKFSDIRCMFEEGAVNSLNHQPKSLDSLDNTSKQTVRKRLRSSSLPSHAEKFFNAIMKNDSALNSINQFNQDLESNKSGRTTAGCSKADMAGYIKSDEFCNTLRYFQDIAKVTNITLAESATTKVFHPKNINRSKSFTHSHGKSVPPGPGDNDCVSNNVKAAENENNKFVNQPSSDSTIAVNKLINALLSGELIVGGSNQCNLSADEVIANYHDSKEFYDTLKFFEEKARAGNQSAIQLVSAMRKYSKHIKRPRRSLPAESEDEPSAPAEGGATRNSLDIPKSIRRRSTPMYFAPTDQGGSVISGEYVATTASCRTTVDGTKSTKTDPIQPLLLKSNPINSIAGHLNNSMKCNSHGPSMNSGTVNDSIMTEESTPNCGQRENIRQSMKFSNACSRCTGNVQTSGKEHALQKTQPACAHVIDSEDLFKAAIVVAEKQNIDVNLDSSSLVTFLAHTAAYMRFEMTSHRIPFDTIGGAILDLISPYRYKPLANVMLDLTTNDREQLISDLKEAVKDFPCHEIKKLALGEICNGVLYLAVSRAVNNFVSKTSQHSDQPFTSTETMDLKAVD